MGRNGALGSCELPPFSLFAVFPATFCRFVASYARASLRNCSHSCGVQPRFFKCSGVMRSLSVLSCKSVPRLKLPGSSAILPPGGPSPLGPELPDSAPFLVSSLPSFEPFACLVWALSSSLASLGSPSLPGPDLASGPLSFPSFLPIFVSGLVSEPFFPSLALSILVSASSFFKSFCFSFSFALAWPDFSGSCVGSFLPTSVFVLAGEFSLTSFGSNLLSGLFLTSPSFLSGAPFCLLSGLVLAWVFSSTPLPLASLGFLESFCFLAWSLI